MKTLLYIFFFSINGFFAVGQSVSGKVTSKDEPVPFASIAIEGGQGVIANEEGEFELKLPAKGQYVISCSAIGYQKVTHKVEVSELENFEIAIELIQNASILDEVVITGTMKATTISESPAPIQVLNSSFFKTNPNPSVFEAIGMVNGIRPQINCNVCSTGDIHINGMEGPYTMVLIDGMPIVSSLSTVYGLMGIPNSLVQRIEVMKGPASTLYGSEAVGGLINIITKNVTTAPKVSLDFSSNTYLENSGDVSFSASKGEVSTLFSANYFGLQKRWDINNDNFTDIPTIQRYSVFNKIKIGERHPLDVAFRYIYENRFGGEMQWQLANRGGEDVYGESIYTNRLEFLGKYSIPIENEKVDFQFSYNHHKQNSVYGSTFFLGDQKVFFGQFLWDKRLSLKNDALFGVAFRSTIYDDNTIATEESQMENRPSIINLPGIFFQNETKFNKSFKILSGLRADFNSKHGMIFSPRLNLKYTTPQNANLRLSLGNGYRVVNIFSEDHAALTGARKVLVMPGIAPEQSYNVNLDYQKFWTNENGYVELQLNAFYTYFDNKILANYDLDPELIVYDNLKGYGISRGFAVNSSFSIQNHTKLELGATYAQVFNQENNVRISQIQTPSFTGNFALSRKITKWNLTMDFTGNVTSPMRLPVVPEYGDTRSPNSPWFSICNLQLRESLKRGFEIYGGVKNIFNYLPIDPIFRPDMPFSDEFDPSYNYAPLQSRRGFLGIRYTFD